MAHIMAHIHADGDEITACALTGDKNAVTIHVGDANTRATIFIKDLRTFRKILASLSNDGDMIAHQRVMESLKDIPATVDELNEDTAADLEPDWDNQP